MQNKVLRSAKCKRISLNPYVHLAYVAFLLRMLPRLLEGVGAFGVFYAPYGDILAVWGFVVW